jgi:hypothetical protein
MRPVILVVLLSLSTILAGLTVFSKRSRHAVLGWLGVGLCQSAFLLVIGFEFLSLLNVLFVLASASVLQIYSALFGTAAIYESEGARARPDWIYGLGAGATIAAILGFAFGDSFSGGTPSLDLETSAFAKEILVKFPELSWILGVAVFLSLVVWASIGRPGWKRTAGGRK